MGLEHPLRGSRPAQGQELRKKPQTNSHGIAYRGPVLCATVITDTVCNSNKSLDSSSSDHNNNNKKKQQR